MRRVGWWLAVAFLSLSTPAFAQGGEDKRFDNKSVVALHQAGLGDNTIIAKVNSVACGYDVTTDGLIALKQAGLSDDVIAAMVARCGGEPRPQATGQASADPSSAHMPGIYVVQDWLAAPQMQLMRPSKASGIKVTGNGSILLPYVGKQVLPDEQSRVGVKSHRPVFYFYFVAGDRKVSDFGTPNRSRRNRPTNSRWSVSR